MRTGEETCLGQMRVFVGGQAQIIIAMALSSTKNIIQENLTKVEHLLLIVSSMINDESSWSYQGETKGEERHREESCQGDSGQMRVHRVAGASSPVPSFKLELPS